METINAAIANGIRLQDGRVVQGYPKQVAIAEKTSKSLLDSSGEYFTIKKKPAKPRQEKVEKKSLEKLFTDHAFLILANRERILGDSRMLLAPVPVNNGLAYSGAFSTATLGVYVEWWQCCPNSVLWGENDEMSLVWHLSGSPLSGANICSRVYGDGRTENVKVPCFIKLWPMFADILADYHEAKQLYQAYSLYEVIEILKRETTAEDYAKNMAAFRMDSKIALLRDEISDWKKRCGHAEKECKDYQKKWHEALIHSRLDQVKDWYNIYMEKKETAGVRIEELKKDNHKLKARLRKGELTNKEYQPLLTKNKTEAEERKMDIHRLEREGLASVFPELTNQWGELEYAEEKILNVVMVFMEKEEGGSNT